MQGNGITKDKAAAAVWLRKSAEAGFAVAQGTLGEIYYFGQGVTKDHTVARSWFEKGAEQNNTKSITNLGLLMIEGQGGAQNKDAGYALLRRAASMGDRQAQAKLDKQESETKRIVDFLGSSTALNG